MGKGQSLQLVVLGKVYNDTQKIEIGAHLTSFTETNSKERGS